MTCEMTRGGEPLHNAPFNPFTHVQVEVDGLCVSSSHLGIFGMSLGELKTGHIHRGHLSGGMSLQDVLPSGLSFGIPRVLVSYK